jgi:hypothetical protein
LDSVTCIKILKIFKNLDELKIILLYSKRRIPEFFVRAKNKIELAKFNCFGAVAYQNRAGSKK